MNTFKENLKAEASNDRIKEKLRKELEEQFIRYVQEKYPGVKVLIVLTMCLEDEAVPILSEQLLKNIGNVKVIPTLAKEFKTREGLIPAYGLEEIIHYIFEGKVI